MKCLSAQAYWQIPEEFILFDTYQCMFSYAGDSLFLGSMSWVLATVWEVLALCLAVWIAVKHFHELWQHSTRGMIGDCFMVLVQTHVSFFARWVHNANVVLLFHWNFACASFLAVSCFYFGLFSPTFSEVCQSITGLYMWAWFIFSAGDIFPGISNLSWSLSDIPDGAVVCAGTTPDPQYSGISC